MNTIIDFLQFACSGFWTFIGVSLLCSMFLYFGVNGVIRVITRFFRLLSVSFRGWPPSHLDGFYVRKEIRYKTIIFMKTLKKIFAGIFLGSTAILDVWFLSYNWLYKPLHEAYERWGAIGVLICSVVLIVFFFVIYLFYKLFIWAVDAFF